jgi:TPR repeat protein
LAQHYRFSVKNPDLENYWLRVAAKNGNKVAQYNLAFNLLECGTTDAEKEEGMALMKKSAADGNTPAIFYLRVLKEQNESKGEEK